VVFNNSGTVEVDAGALHFTGGVTQLSGGTLTGGTWHVVNSILALPTTNITSVAASILMDGASAQIENSGSTSALAHLASIAAGGNLTLQNGFNLATASALANSGSLTIGPSSTLTVNGNYSQTAAAALNINIGGHSAGGQFGTLAITQTPTLAGSLNIGLVNGLVPGSADRYQIMSFADGARSTDFANKNGLTFTGG
jgi:hypothetical protein